MNNAITFYHNPMSRGRIVHWMLEETGAPYEVKLLDFSKAEHKQPAYLAINSMGKVPAIVHRNTAITETAAICTYLADAFPNAKLAPSIDDPARGTYLRWMFFSAGCAEPAIMDKILNRPPTDKPSFIGYGTFNDTLSAIEKAVTKGPFILGDKFSAADLYLAAQIGFGVTMKSIDPSPVLQSYLGRCTDRPAYKRMVDQNAEFEKKLKKA